MAYWARVDENDYYQETINFDPEGHFHESLIWRQIPENATEWLNDHIKVTADNVLEADDLDHFKLALKGRVSGQRYVKENQYLDITVSSGETRFWIDRITLLLLSETKRAVTAGTLAVPLLWKVYDLSFVELTESDIDTVIAAIMTNKQKSFKAEKATYDIIDAMTTVQEFVDCDIVTVYEEQYNLA